MERLFQVKFVDEITTLWKTEAGVCQGSVSEHVLYSYLKVVYQNPSYTRISR
jgi:hypothetical protein